MPVHPITDDSCCGVAEQYGCSDRQAGDALHKGDPSAGDTHRQGDETGFSGPLRSRTLDPRPTPLQVMGMVGSARKRMLMLWQAVEMSRALEAPDHVTLALARAALEPAPDPRNPERLDEALVGRAPLATGIPRHWSIVRCGCIEGAHLGASGCSCRSKHPPALSVLHRTMGPHPKHQG